MIGLRMQQPRTGFPETSSGVQMPKMKSHKGAKKRFKVTGTGKVRRYKAFKSHILTKKTSKRKRRLRQAGIVATTGDTKRVKRLLLA